ncbi:hypothetical protein PYW07_001702 [Mythimna separata]|uniref:Tudor domain-containing protein n=1 Tax=Mythimna separata TaxID=271217 RepID=A0AAD7YUE1_MYTSE|nr:hypothetical protein PYW07_001702 [Mythimna separata]
MSELAAPSSEMTVPGMNNIIYDFMVGYDYKVDVTHINDPKSFFVRAADVDDLLKFIERPGLKVSASEIKLGQRVIYKSNILNRFVRGVIHQIKIKKEKVRCNMFAVDYGCRENSVSIKLIYQPHSKTEPHSQCPGMATHCRLHLCEPKGETFSNEVIDTMKHLVGSHTATINVQSKSNDQLVVELITVDCPRDVATMLGLIGLTTLTKGPYTVNRLTHSTQALKLTQTLKFKHKELKVGDVLHVRVQSGSSASGFYVADINDFKTLRRAEASFSQYCKGRHMKDEDFVPGRPCAVKLDNLGQYERAIIKEVHPNSKAVLKLVDWVYVTLLDKRMEEQYKNQLGDVLGPLILVSVTSTLTTVKPQH